MPNKKKLYEALKAEGYDNFTDESAFNSYVDNPDNRKKLFDALKSEGYDNFADEKSFDAYLGYSEPQSNNSGEQESVIDVPSDEMTEGDTQDSYQYNPKVQRYILDNKPDMFKPKTVDMYGAHDKDKGVLDLMNEGKLYQMKAMRAASTIGEQLNERIKANDKALKEAYSQREKNNQGHRFVFGAGANVAPKINTNKDDENIKNLLAEQEYLGSAKKVFDAAKDDAGFFRGMKDAVDSSWLTFGISDLHNAERIAVVQQKLDAGQALSDSEQSLLTSLGLQQMVNEQYNDLLGRWYKAGMVTAEMAPFMAEMAVNPLSGLGKSAMKFAVKKFGEKGAKAIAAKVLSRTIGDVAGAAGMAATTSMAGVTADALERQRGYVKTDLDEKKGTIKGVGFEGGEDASDAWRKAFTSRTIENWSEMVGEYFSPIGKAVGKGFAKAFDKMGLSKVNDFIDNINSSEWVKLLDDFSERTQWNGALGEFAEEQVGMVANAALVGDTKWSDITDLDQQLDVALGVGVFGTVMSLLRIGGYRTPKYRARKAVEGADKEGAKLYGEELWETVKFGIDNSSDEELGNVLATMIAATGANQEQAEAAFKYANALKAQQAVNTVKEKAKIDMPGDMEVEAEAAYDEGLELQTPYDKHSAKRSVDRAEAALGVGSENSDEQQFAQMVMAGANSPVETINAMAEQGYSDEQIQKAKDYYTAYHRMNGLTDALLDNVDSQIESAIREVDANTNKDNGSVTKVVLRDGRTGYIVEGTVVRGEKGIVDVNNSDETVMVRLENGEVKMMNPNKDLYGVAWIDSPENVKEEINVVLREKLIDKAIGEIDWNPATPNPKVGDSFEMEGVPVTIVAHDGNGGMFVVPTEEYQSAVGSEKKMQELIANAQQSQPIPASEYKNWASAQLDAQEEAAKVQQEVASGESVGEQVNAGVNVPVNTETQQSVAEKRPMTEDEAASFIFQMERNAVEAPEIELTPENWIAEFGEDGLVETPIGQVKFGQGQYLKLQQQGRNGKLGMIRPTLANPDVIVEDASKAKEGDTAERGTSYVFIKSFKGKDGKRMYYFTSITVNKDGNEVVVSNQEKKRNRIMRLLQEGNVIWRTPNDATTSSAERQGLYYEQSSEAETTAKGSVVTPQTTSSTNKDSESNVQSQEKEQKPLHEREKEDVFRELGEKYGEKMPHKVEVTAKAFADDVVKAQQKLDDAQRKLDDAPIGRDSKQQAARDKAQQELDAIKVQADFWAEMDAEIKAAQSMPGEDVADEILSMEEPLTGEEFAAQMLANGNIKLLRESFASETGFGNEESKKYFGLFASSEKGGMTVQQAGERLMEMDRENGTNFFDQNAPNAGRNAIIEVLGVAKTKKELANIIPNNRSEQARKEQEAEYAAYEAWIEENFHMSVQDYEAYNGPYIQELATSIITDEDFNDFMSAFVDETIKNNQDEQGNIAKSKGSSEVLSGTQPLQTERVEGIEEESNEVDGGVFEKNGALPEGASERVNVQDDDWTEEGKYGETYKRTIIIDGIHYVTQVDEANKSGNYTGSYFILDGKRFAGIPEVLEYIDNNGAVEKTQEVLDSIKQARNEVDANPTEAQKESGNYKKGHVKIDGYDITIENPKDGVRSGTDKNGKKWSITMNNDYGYIRGTEAVDGDHIDVFLSDNPTEGSVFVVDQSNEDGSFDESKVMYGFSSLDEARSAYLSNYEKGWESRIMAITEVSKDEFKKWIDSSHRKTKAFSEYKSVKANEQKPYTIEPAIYTTKKGKVLDMFLVKPTNNEMSRERQSEARFWANDMRGWYDRKEGGWMLRSKEDADKFVEKVFGDMHSESYDLVTMKSVTDGDVSFSEPIKADEYSPTWQYIVSVDKESGFTTLRRDDVSGIIPIGDARFTISATSPEEMLDILRNPLNGMQEVLDAVEVSLENKVKTRAMDAAIKNESKKEPTNPSGNKLVSDERYAELRERMRKKLGGQMNIGIDPEILAIGTEMAVYHIEKGARKFAEYAKAMIADLGDAIRPYLKAFYNGARDLPEMQNEGLTSEMTSYEEVSSFDVANFDKASSDVEAAVETIAKEQEVEKQAEVAKVRVKKQSKPKKKTKESVSLLGDLFNQNIEENESNDDGRGNRQKASGVLPTNGGRKHVASTTGNQTTDESLGSQPRKEDSQSDRRGFDTGVHGRDVSDENGSDRVHGSTIEQPVKRNVRNFSFGEGHIEVPSGDIAKLKANIAAIRTLKEIEASGQPATDAQKAVLAKYVGWGGLSAALDEQKFLNSKGWMADRNWNEKYLPYYKELRDLLTKEEFNDAVQSTLTSHYTPEEIIRGMWNVVERMGFKGGRINEPAAGIGHILGLMPLSISERSIISGTELDSLSGRIAKALYPDANIKVQGYEKEFAPKSKDLVITNVPFGKTAPYDKALDKALRKKMGSAYNLHNYFIAKGLLELKEGGIGVFVTSSATMDGANSKFREWVAANGIDLIGAIRLPNNAFLKNAGTSVTADMLVFRKRKSGEPSNGVDFISTTQVGEGNYVENGKTHTKPIMVNEYFAEHPEMMLGEMMTAHDAGSGGLYSGASQTCVAKKGANLGEELQNAILRLDSIDKNLSESQNSIGVEGQEQTTDLKNGTLVVKGDEVLIAMNGELQPIELSQKKKEFTFNGKKQKTAHAVRDYIALKETLKSLIAAEQTSTENPEPLRKKLNKEYDAFVAKYGTLNRNKALDDVFSEDFEHNLPLSLENVKRVPSATGKSMVWEVTKGEGILSKRVSYPVEEPTKAENLDDAIHISRSYRGVIDVPYVAALLGQTEEEVTNDMLQEGLAYRNPITGNLEDKESYLSGNVKEKLEQARAMAEEHPEYQKNVEDLAEVQPETVRFGDISYRIGTPWIPTEYVNDFASEVLGVRSVDVQYVPELNEFVVSKFARVDDFAKAGQFRTDRVGVIDLLEYALNQRKPKIFDKHVSYGPMGKVEERIPNEAETQAAAEKIMEISDKFIEYIDGRSNIHRELERIYNDKYNNYRLKTYELPSFSKMEKDKEGKDVLATHYPNSNTSISLREHQAKAVQRCLSESTLLAHQVGTGKTFTMITAAMEMRRLGIANKPMIVVQNATLEDFVKDFYKLYPGANVLAPGKDERSAENRKRLFNLIATGDFDAIVIPQSFMQFIPDDEGRKKELIQKRIEEYERALEKIEDYSLQKRMQKEIDSLRDTLEGKEKKRSVKDSAKAKESIKAKVEKTLDRRTDEVLTFEQMGIDALFIDEAHNYKKIGFASKMSNVKGIDTSASQRANSLLLKAQYVQEKNGGRNVILATGTPITNTMAEVWTMMKFVSPEILETYNIQGFDDFATTFGTVEPSLEFTATGNFKIADRFKSYVNVPELVKAFRSHADVVLTSDVKEFKESNNIPKLKDDQMTNVVIEKNEDLEDVMDILIKKLEAYNEMSGSEKREWSALPLVVFSRAKQAAIDLRLLNPSYEDNPNSKTNHVVRNVLKLYKESTPEKGAQMIFCDSYQSPGEAPKMDLFDYDADIPRFNLYEDIKKKLVEGGVPANEIAIVNNYDGERRKQLFEKVRNGDVRVLLGSTEKMGVGVNVQDRMFALHHIDAPIRPMDFEQRNGRILRQGNLYATWGKPVNVVTYGVQGTLDATAYDRLRVKQDFINQMMKGDVSGRIMEEQDEEDPSGMTFNQMAATLSGDQTAQLLFVAENELKKLLNLKRSDFNSKSGMGMTIQSEERRLVTLNDKLELWGKAKEITSKYFPEGVTEVKVNGETFTEKLGPSLDPVIENYEEAYSLNRGIAPLKISLNNGNGEVIVHFDEGKMVYELYAGKEHVVESRQFNGGKGLMSSIEHQLKATEKNYNETKQKIAETKSKIQGLEKAMNAPWGREEELKKKEQEVADLKKQLEEKALENSKNRPVEQPKNEVAVDSEEEVLYRPNANFRSGQGALTTDEISMANDPIGKVLGYSTRTASERKTFAERERVRMVQRVNSLAKKLGLKNVDIVLDGSTLNGKKAKAKGFYSRTNRKITIVISNHTSVFDVEQTLLHEAVAHYGLRELFGAQFDIFLDNVYNNAANDVRERINRLAEKNGWDFHTATEEYLASLAEDTNFETIDESWWNKIKQLFLDMLHQIGFNEFRGVTLTDNELRYILWRSYENLSEPGSRRSIFGEATDIVMQNKLKVGNYSYAKFERERDRLLATGRTNSRVAEGDVYTYTPEDVIQEFEEIVANHPDIYAIRTEEDIDGLPTDRYTKRDIKKKFNNPRVTGTNVEGGMMILFVDRMDESELRATIPHELAHYASRNLKIDDFYKMYALSYLRKNYSDEYQKVVDSYPKEKWGEEAVSHLFEKKVEELGFEKILNGKFDSRNDIGYIFHQITNFLNYGKRRGIPGYRKGLSGQSYTGAESEGQGVSQKTGILGNAERQVQQRTGGSVSSNDGRRADSELGAVSGSSMGERTSSKASEKQATIDREYLEAVRSGDFDKAISLFRKYVLSKAEEDGVIPIDYAVGYRGHSHSSIAKKVKEENPDAISEAAYQMSKRVPKGSILVPMPSRSGKATYTIKLAEAIAKATDSEVKDVLKGEERMSVYEAKKKGLKIDSNDLGLYVTEKLPKEKNVVIVDNVIDRGITALAAVKAVDGGSVLSYAFTKGSKDRVVPLKLSDPITYDDNLRIIPLSERFNANTDDLRYREMEDEELLFRIDDEIEGMADNTARKLYEDSIKGKGYRFQEGFQDSMLSLKKLQEAIVKQHGGKLEEWEDAYTAENQMSSRDTSEIENFVFNHFKPMMKEVAKVLKRGGMTYEELRTYLFAKSGLERNRDFAVRDAIAQREKDGEDVSGIYEAYMQRKQELLQDLKDGTISFREYCEEMDNEAMMIAPDLMGKDYSGLSSLFSEDNFTEDAIAEVEAVEDLVDTSELWDVIKGATQFTLDRAKQSGIMNTDVHKKLSEMFEWYIPMRGWSETKARDVYEYFSGQEGVFNPSVKNAYGRKSLADDPLATISNMAESAIFQGNKNQMKQKLLNIAFDKPTNLITVMDSWIENKGTETDPRWEYVYPPIELDDDADVIAAKIKLFEEEMEQKKDEGRAKKLRGKADIPYIATPKEIAEHIIRVKRNGREFVMILNGNPRAAQAVNGMTNPETYNGIIEQVSRKLNRFMAAAFTTKNPTFIMRNLSRDLIFSNTAVAVKENTAYGKKFRGNQLKVLGNMRGLMKRYQSGNLDMSNELDKMFMEFIKNGGETGFAQLTSVDEYKKKIQRELNIAKNGGAINKGKKVGRAVMDTIEFYNRCAEDVSRFTVFMTSRQMGRSIQRSVSDAKEITVNFNKRGSGSKAGGFIGFGAQSMRSLYLFFNAAVQALVNFKRLGQKHPVAFTSALSMYAVSGFLMPVVNEFLSSILGGDDDDYENLPEWVRRNNLVISLGKWGGDAMFLTVPLPIEMRAFYGLGETANQMMAGNVRGKDAALQIAGQFAEMLPLNFVTDAAGPWNAFTPDAFKPIVQAYITNKDWTGKPIYRDNGFNKELPEWTKAYAGTSKWLVNSAELMNEFTGGDKYKSGGVDVNPARLEHLFTGYLGGFGDMFLGAYKTLSMPFDEDYRNVRHVPVLKAFLNQSDERTSYAQVKKDYASYKHEYEDTVRRLNGYEKELNRPETAMEYAERMDFLYRSPQMKRYEIMREYERELSKMYKMMQEYPDSEVQKSIMVSINQLKANAIERLRNIE